MTPPEEPRERDAQESSPPPEAGRLDRIARLYLSDPTLWPVVIVLGTTLIVLGAWVSLLALRERNLFAAAALLLLIGMSAEAIWRDLRRRRLGAVSGAILGLWAAIAATAALAVGYGFF